MIPIQDTVQSRSVPLATWGLILVNGLVFLQELALPPEGPVSAAATAPADRAVHPGPLRAAAETGREKPVAAPCGWCIGATG
jgi:hypothetical protein